MHNFSSHILHLPILSLFLLLVFLLVALFLCFHHWFPEVEFEATRFSIYSQNWKDYDYQKTIKILGKPQ